MDIVIVTAEQWCNPCIITKAVILPIAKEMGIPIGIIDLGAKKNFNENKGILLDKGYEDFYSVPTFFGDKKKIDRPDSLSVADITKWLNRYSKQ